MRVITNHVSKLRKLFLFLHSIQHIIFIFSTNILHIRGTVTNAVCVKITIVEIIKMLQKVPAESADYK